MKVTVWEVALPTLTFRRLLLRKEWRNLAKPMSMPPSRQASIRESYGLLSKAKLKSTDTMTVAVRASELSVTFLRY